MKHYLAFILVALLFGITSCKKPKEQEFDRAAMLENIAASHIVPEYQNLKSELSLLSAKTATFETDPTTLNLGDLRNQFMSTYLNFERVKMFNFGPAEDANPTREWFSKC